MGRCSIQIVMGPAGSGKSTYCSMMQQHCATKRLAAVGSSKYNIPVIHVANLDPAAEYFNYEPIFDIRDIITVTDVMDEIQLGPNGALIYCMEYIFNHHMEWLHNEIDTNMNDDDYLFIDCPGQIELYTHIPIQKRIIDTISNWGYTGHIVSVFCIDSTFCTDVYKLISGTLLSLSTMIALELPHVTVLTKCDLIETKQLDRILNDYTSANYLYQIDQNQQSLLYLLDNTSTNTNNVNNVGIRNDNFNDLYANTTSSTSTATINPRRRQRQEQQHGSVGNNDNDDEEDIITTEDIAAIHDSSNTNESETNHKTTTTTTKTTTPKNDNKNSNTSHTTTDEIEYIKKLESRRQKRHILSQSIASLIDDYSMISFLPLNIYDEDSCDHVLYTINHCIQYGEDHDVYGADDNDDNDQDYNDNDNDNDRNDNE